MAVVQQFLGMGVTASTISVLCEPVNAAAGFSAQRLGVVSLPGFHPA